MAAAWLLIFVTVAADCLPSPHAPRRMPKIAPAKTLRTMPEILS